MFQNNLRDLDLSCKTDLDLLDCFGRENSIFLKPCIHYVTTMKVCKWSFNGDNIYFDRIGENIKYDRIMAFFN